MGIRLNKVTRQLNVGVRTIVQFLKLHRIGEMRYDADPNTKISDEQYEAVVKHFGFDQQVKIEAESMSENKEKPRREAHRKKTTPEQRIAANKERIAKFHPEPDFSRMSPRYVKELKKLDHEKSMKEKAKKIWLSIVSIPMGGLNK